VLETSAARLILGCLSALPKEFGRYVLASVLRGSASPVILDNDLDQNPFYGDLGKLSKKDIINMIDALIEKGFIDTVVKEEEISNIKISDRGELGLDGKDIAWVPLPFPLHNQLEPIFTPQQKAVMPELRSMRRNLAHANDIPPYLVFNDDTLKDIALKLPTTPEELEKVKGIKEVKAKKYSKEILETVQWALEDFDGRDELDMDMDEDVDDEVEEETGEASPDIIGELEEMKSILPVVDTDGSAKVNLNSMLQLPPHEDEATGAEVFPITQESMEGEQNIVLKIPVKRIAISKETGEELNICDKCGAYYHISLEFCPHCDESEESEKDEDETEEEVEGGEEFETEEDEMEDLEEEDTGEVGVIELGEGPDEDDGEVGTVDEDEDDETDTDPSDNDDEENLESNEEADAISENTLNEKVSFTIEMDEEE